jgi:hypothetical protein
MTDGFNRVPPFDKFGCAFTIPLKPLSRYGQFLINMADVCEKYGIFPFATN